MSVEMKAQTGCYNFKVHSFDVDFNGNIFLSHVLKFLQEAAYLHATENDFGYAYLHEQNKFWVLSRISMKIHRLPKWDDEISVHTWPSGPEGLFAKREFELKIGEELCISVSSFWLIVDAVTKRPQRLNQFHFSEFNFKTDLALDTEVLKIGTVDGLQVGTKNICYSDVDVNKHVNNTEYIRYVLDCLPEDVLQNKQIEELHVNFLGETMLHDVLSVWKQTDVKSDRFSLKNQNEKEVCKIELVYVS